MVAGSIDMGLQPGSFSLSPEPGAGCQVRLAQGRAVNAPIARAADLCQCFEMISEDVVVQS